MGKPDGRADAVMLACASLSASCCRTWRTSERACARCERAGIRASAREAGPGGGRRDLDEVVGVPAGEARVGHAARPRADEGGEGEVAAVEGAGGVALGVVEVGGDAVEGVADDGDVRYLRSVRFEGAC